MAWTFHTKFFSGYPRELWSSLRQQNPGGVIIVPVQDEIVPIDEYQYKKLRDAAFWSQEVPMELSGCTMPPAEWRALVEALKQNIEEQDACTCAGGVDCFAAALCCIPTLCYSHMIAEKRGFARQKPLVEALCTEWNAKMKNYGLFISFHIQACHYEPLNGSSNSFGRSMTRVPYFLITKGPPNCQV